MGISVDDVAKMTVKELQKHLKERSLKTAGRKAELAKRLTDSLEQAQSPVSKEADTDEIKEAPTTDTPQDMDEDASASPVKQQTSEAQEQDDDEGHAEQDAAVEKKTAEMPVQTKVGESSEMDVQTNVGESRGAKRKSDADSSAGEREEVEEPSLKRKKRGWGGVTPAATVDPTELVDNIMKTKEASARPEEKAAEEDAEVDNDDNGDGDGDGHGDGDAEEESAEDATVATECLRVDGFVRPFPIPRAKRLFSAHGTLLKFWMDAIRTHAYVIFEKSENAAKAKRAIDGQKWPDQNGGTLHAKFVEKSEAERAISGVPQPKGDGVTSPKARSERQSALSKAIQEEKQRAAAANSENAPPKADDAIPTLDLLFRKTKTLPALYYLPLTEQEVKEKEARAAVAASSGITLPSAKPRADGRYDYLHTGGGHGRGRGGRSFLERDRGGRRDNRRGQGQAVRRSRSKSPLRGGMQADREEERPWRGGYDGEERGRTSPDRWERGLVVDRPPREAGRGRGGGRGRRGGRW